MDNYNPPVPFTDPLEKNIRPGFLTFLCVLTFIGSGLSLFTNLFSPVLAPIALEFIKGSSFESIPGILDVYEQLIKVPAWQFFLVAFFCASSIIGAIFMLKMKKIGFHIYAISQLSILFISQLIIGGIFKPKWTDIFFTLLFIGLYAIYYSRFSNLEEDKEE
ncbi:MAG: hypothetical protein LBU83_08010 [Bacteroidales bacterium]|jgi:hypothetical protein|nr:hypothetical protein [Bacteroidales bacterium]